MKTHSGMRGGDGEASTDHQARQRVSLGGGQGTRMGLDSVLGAGHQLNGEGRDQKGRQWERGCGRWAEMKLKLRWCQGRELGTE